MEKSTNTEAVMQLKTLSEDELEAVSGGLASSEMPQHYKVKLDFNPIVGVAMPCL